MIFKILQIFSLILVRVVGVSWSNSHSEEEPNMLELFCKKAPEPGTIGKTTRPVAFAQKLHDDICPLMESYKGMDIVFSIKEVFGADTLLGIEKAKEEMWGLIREGAKIDMQDGRESIAFEMLDEAMEDGYIFCEERCGRFSRRWRVCFPVSAATTPAAAATAATTAAAATASTTAAATAAAGRLQRRVIEHTCFLPPPLSVLLLRVVLLFTGRE